MHYIEITSSTSLQPKNAITVSTWIKSNYVPDGIASHIIDKHNSVLGTYSLGGYAITCQPDGPGFFIVTNPSSPTHTYKMGTTNIIGDGNFYHIAGTYDGISVKLYFDGNLVGTASASGDIVHLNQLNLIFGKNLQPDAQSRYERQVDGVIDDVRIYNRALSETEIQELYHEGEACDDRYDEGYEAGKQYCINNPEACGWLGGYTQSDLDNARQEGYNSGCDDCSNGSSNPATISPELNLHIPTLQYQSPFGAMDLWVDFEFAGESNGDMLWKLSDFGQK
ncbi:MAG: LamG domain-containing protein [Desulfamplus sp.]|nr:LamG domain-containing protein [Desulfamplus sp.]